MKKKEITMLDSKLRPIIDIPLNKIAKKLSKYTSATSLTLIGFGFGLVACGLAFYNMYLLALVFLILNRVCDGLDGAVARVRDETSDFGGYLDIVLDFFIYAGFPFVMAFGMNDMNCFMAVAFVIFAMVTTGVSFLAYATIAAKRDMTTEAQGKKSFYFSRGLMEGTETIIFLCLLCLLPQYFAILCFTFGTLCLITTAMRIHMAYHVFQ